MKVCSIGLRGMEGYRVQVEVKELPGIPSVVIVGLPDPSVKEAKKRVVATRARQYERYGEEVTNVLVPVDVLFATSRLTKG